MATKRAFTREQEAVLFQTVERVRAQFADQEDMALALGVSQQTVSNWLARKYTPSMAVARELALLDGRKLTDLLPNLNDPPQTPADPYPNLTSALAFFSSEGRTWQPWTVAAIRAGLFGEQDVGGSKWAERLDKVEAALARTKK